MRALPQTLPANAALLATGVTSAGAACSLGGCCRLTRGVIVGDALALRVCLCVPTFRFRETEEAFMNATSSECSRGPGRLPACVPRGRGQRPGGCRPSHRRIARRCASPAIVPAPHGRRAPARARERPAVAGRGWLPRGARGAGGCARQRRGHLRGEATCVTPFATVRRRLAARPKCASPVDSPRSSQQPASLAQCAEWRPQSAPCCSCSAWTPQTAGPTFPTSPTTGITRHPC